MNFPLLPMWNLQPNRPCFYDTDSATMLELASKMQYAFNEIVKDYNNFVKESEEKRKAFEVGIRQEFQDFINAVDLRVDHLESVITDVQTHMSETLNEALKTGKITVDTVYDPETESLNFIFNGVV